MNPDAAARAAIKDAIHARDGVVLGRDPLGRPCRCNICAWENAHVPQPGEVAERQDPKVSMPWRSTS